ncbi:uncharacterized protein N7483_011827 [Penicillium malachiteum]|uniref:uncharacterized protein n=1 Tax=Penicillium malachiteum TaxID=1324776 RepID=UPI002546E53E|nr:uncharacterized protein N7483_011827 [Penicillium malachiteum]KAJ5714646.1 hypothetical protein N7483_011827 [Penicillium malachiteum]
MGLGDLPTEILLEIADFLYWSSDQYSLAQTNQRSWVTLKKSLYVHALRLAEEPENWERKWAHVGLLIATAARAVDAEMFSKLIAFRESPDDFAEECEVALANAISHGQIELAKAVLGSGVHLNLSNLHIQTDSGILCDMPAFHAAAYKGQVDMIRLLFDRDADPYVKDRQGFMPLWIATFYGMTEVMRVLLEFGVRADGRDQDGHEHEPIPADLFLIVFQEKLEEYNEGMYLVPGGQPRLNSLVPFALLLVWARRNLSGFYWITERIQTSRMVQPAICHYIWQY